MPESNSDPTNARAPREYAPYRPVYSLRQRDLAAPTAIPNEEQLDKVVVVGPGPRRRRRHAALPLLLLLLQPGARPHRSRPAERTHARVVSETEGRNGGERGGARGRIGAARSPAGVGCGDRGAGGAGSGVCAGRGARRGDGNFSGGGNKSPNRLGWGFDSPGA